MRDLSEYKLLGNYLVNLYEKYGVDSIRYENAQNVTNNILTKLNSPSTSYKVMPIEPKYDIVKTMISKGVFRTNPSNRIVPFKQVYNYEVTKGIYAVYSCDKSLVFKIQITQNDNKDFILKNLRDIYCKDLGLDLQNAINRIISTYKPVQNKGRSK